MIFGYSSSYRMTTEYWAIFVYRGNNVKVVDDNIDSYRTEDRGLDIESGDDAPVIAGIIDERPREIRDMEMYKKTDRWKPLANDDGGLW